MTLQAGDISALEKYQAAFRAEMQKLLALMQARDISYAVWRGRVENELRALHLFAAALAVGGVDRLTPADRDRLNLLVDAQLAYFHSYAAQEMPPVQQQVRLSRLNLYAGAARGTYSRFVARAMGLPELPAYPGDGSAPCGNNDRCLWIIQPLAGDGNWDVTWQLDASAENCVVCQRRFEVWNPLKIRGHVIALYDTTGVFA